MYRITRKLKGQSASASSVSKKSAATGPKPKSKAGKTTGRPAKRPRAKKPKAAVLGIGNPLMCDDGAGIEVLDALRKMTLPAGVEILDCGTGGMTLLHALADYRAVVIADAVDFGGKPGEVKSFSPYDAVSVKELKRLSLHEGDAFETIVLARRLGQCPERIVICAIQPKRIEPRHGMTRDVRTNLPELASHVRLALERLLAGRR
jgi:hydrogenase maturation protease